MGLLPGAASSLSGTAGVKRTLVVRLARGGGTAGAAAARKAAIASALGSGAGVSSTGAGAGASTAFGDEALGRRAHRRVEAG